MCKHPSFSLLTPALLLLAAVLSCQREEPFDAPGERGPAAVQYVDVGLSFVYDRNAEGGETKSVLSPGCEDIQRILAFAFDTAGDIKTYGSNAGSLSGQNIVLQQEGTIETWTLPTGTALDLRVIANPPDALWNSASAISSITTVSALEALWFTCNQSGLTAMASGSKGIPKAGSLAVASGDITTDDCTLNIPLKNLFAKYSLSFDLSMVPQTSKVEVKCVKLYNSNTRLPYYAEDYCQSSSTYLKEFDYATAEDLQKLAKGKPVTVYAMENCHGLHTGAKSWKTVATDIAGWSELPYCTKMLVDVEIDGVSQSFVVYLGSGDMKTDFNVRRNVYKEIKIRLRPGHPEGSGGFFEFDQDFAPLTIMQGGTLYLQQLFTENLYKYISGQDYIDFAFYEADGTTPSTLFTILSTDYMHMHTDFEFSCTSTTPLGTYWLEGGHFSEFTFDGTTHPAVRDRIQVRVVENLSVDFSLKTASGDIYPFLPVEYESTSEYTDAKATSIISELSVSTLDPNILSYSLSKRSTGTGTKIVLTMIPKAPGSVASQKVSFNGALKNLSGFTVWTPQLKAGVNSVSLPLTGANQSVSYWLTKKDGSTPLNYEGRTGLNYSVSLTNPSNVDIGKAFSTAGADPSARTLLLNLRSFDNLPGFSEDNWAFTGYDFTVKAMVVFTAAGGIHYQVSTEIPGTIANPCPGWDGNTYNYRVDQGASIPSSETYVTCRFIDDKVYYPEYMLDWPTRIFYVDLSRGGSRSGMTWSAYDTWSEYSAVSSTISTYNPSTAGKVSFFENLNYWGPIYYGKRVTNSVSGETKSFVHSIIRLYGHFNAFATVKVREDSYVGKGGLFDSSPNGNPYYDVENWTYGNTGLGTLKVLAAWLNTMRSVMNIIASMGMTTPMSVLSIVTGWTLALDDSQTGVIDASLKTNFSKSSIGANYNSFITKYTPEHIYAFDGTIYSSQVASDNSLVEIIDVLGITGNPSDDSAYCTLGYMPGTGSTYHIISDKVMITRGLGGEAVGVPNWRRLLAQNEPWFKIVKRSFHDLSPYASGQYIFFSAPTKVKDGLYNICVSKSSSYSSNPDKQRYLDDNNMGYQYIHLFWEGKKGKHSVKASVLNPRTDHGSELNAVLGDYKVTLANGWYDPSLYFEKGLPIIGEKVGKYFFPDSNGSADRVLSGDSGSHYYPGELPWKTNCYSTKMETDLTNANTTDNRDINAYHKYLGNGQFE